MGAIDRDREIAAKATQGKWTHGRRTTRIIYATRVCSSTRKVLDIIQADKRYDAEHIVRRHNRQPFYDKLVDAVRDLAKRIAESRGKGRMNLNDAVAEVLQAYVALDLEGP